MNPPSVLIRRYRTLATTEPSIAVGKNKAHLNQCGQVVINDSEAISSIFRSYSAI